MPFLRPLPSAISYNAALRICFPENELGGGPAFGFFQDSRIRVNQTYFRAQTERWIMSEGIKRVIEPTLDNETYSFGIGLVLVDKGFCSLATPSKIDNN